MEQDKRAAANWDKAQNAYAHYQAFIATKPDPYALSFADLVFVRNFKGGSSIVSEPVATLQAKLRYYEQAIRACGEDASFSVRLDQLGDKQYGHVRNAIVAFASIPTNDNARIAGFGPSFASTLLHFYFPLLVPILDKRALNGGGIDGIEVDQANNVVNLLQLYPRLIDVFRQRLRAQRNSTLRQLDREFFVKPLKSPPFK